MMKFAGSLVAMVTPFRDGALDEDALRKLTHWHIEQGTDGWYLSVRPANHRHSVAPSTNVLSRCCRRGRRSCAGDRRGGFQQPRRGH